jgi:hypothetical protein
MENSLERADKLSQSAFKIFVSSFSISFSKEWKHRRSLAERYRSGAPAAGAMGAKAAIVTAVGVTCSDLLGG